MNSALSLNPAPPLKASRRPRLLLFAGGLLVVAAAALGTQSYLGRGPAPITVTDTSGAATFNFRVTAIPVPGKIEGVTPALTFSPGDLAATHGRVTLGLGTLDTGIALRDRHAKEFLGVAEHPSAVFLLRRLEGAARIQPGQQLNVVADGTLSLNGVTAPLKAPVQLSYARDGSAIEVQTAFNVLFRQHHISIPGADPATDVKVTFRLPIRR